MLKAGDQLGDYEIVSHVTSGGMAALYLGRRPGARGFAKSVAIKVVHERLSEEEDIQRMFVDEAILSSHLSHPNIVHVEEFGESDKHLYLVMEYVDGCSLTDLLKHLLKHGRMLTVTHAVRIAIEVAAGLHAAHESTDGDGRPLHVVHRDVSPGNVLLSKAGHIKMIDFGIATSSAQANESIEGNFKGKFRYMSPEQASGKPLDRRSDIYSLGLVLWELLTGQAALKSATNLGILELARDPKIAPPSTIRRRGISPAVDEAVLWPLKTTLGERPETALEFRRRLVQACPEALGVETETLGELVRSVPSRRRRKSTPSAPSLDELVVRSTSTLPPPREDAPRGTPAPAAPLGSISSRPAPDYPGTESTDEAIGVAVEPVSEPPRSSFAVPVLNEKIGDGRRSMVDQMLDQLPDFSAAHVESDRTLVEPNMLENLPDLSDADATFADPNFEEKVAAALQEGGVAQPSTVPRVRGSQSGAPLRIAKSRPARSQPAARKKPRSRSRSRESTDFIQMSAHPVWRVVLVAILVGALGFVGTALVLLLTQW